MAGIYIHIPFCRQNCHYCDFYFSVSLNYKNQIVDAILKEIQLRKDYLNHEQIETIYLGGGTPSVLSPKEIEKIMHAIYTNHNVSNNVETTLEANPDDIQKDYLASIADAGINRLSIGIQSFDDKELKLMNRRHDSVKATSALDAITNSRFKNFSADLIYAIPGSNLKVLSKNITALLHFNVPHISIYHLTYEDGTIFKHKVKKQRLQEIGEEGSIEQYSLIMSELKRCGYNHYEISNFSKEGFISRHNTSYWFGKQYLGIGPSAHSYNGNSRQWNVPALGKYIEGVNENGSFFEKEELNTNTKFNEYIMVRLRTKWGIIHDEMKDQFGRSYLAYFLEKSAQFVQNGLMCQDKFHTVMKSEHLLKSDYVIASLFIN